MTTGFSAGGASPMRMARRTMAIASSAEMTPMPLVRSSQIPQIDPHKFSLEHWTERRYYEVCSNPAIYAMLEGKAAKGSS